ncbi:L-threonylcarbamoyladenylate synthase [Microbacterium hominis]|uniref:Translation factor (SUA5) n=1 Tax=Microbacterium hominis TaxID=162426 RepID=A0A0B4CJF8_9MICO|nr:Sua5/YciO/YrdC/YwlC family protein [Microbacterium hominis]KIC56612.1 translation factor (SUA5) [Microbacterium hominis]
MESTRIGWGAAARMEAVCILAAREGMIVSPTKVGYIVMAVDRTGLERKFDAKQRSLSKPAVVLVSSLEQLRQLAQLTPEIEGLYQRCWDEDVLLGCILPWSVGGLELVSNDGTRELVMDERHTSCFVIRFGAPSEAIAQDLWDQYGMLTFASSANPSGHGNRGVLAGIGARLADRADLLIEADDYVASNQPDRTVDDRYEQGVMVSMVDRGGRLVPEQHGQRSVTPAPALIRKGLALDRIMMMLAASFPSWDYRHGDYY